MVLNQRQRRRPVVGRDLTPKGPQQRPGGGVIASRAVVHIDRDDGGSKGKSVSLLVGVRIERGGEAQQKRFLVDRVDKAAGVWSEVAVVQIEHGRGIHGGGSPYPVGTGGVGEDVRSPYIVLGGVEEIDVAKRLIVGRRSVQQ